MLDPHPPVLDGPSYNLNLTHEKHSETQIAGAKYRHLGAEKPTRMRHVRVALREVLIKETET